MRLKMKKMQKPWNLLFVMNYVSVVTVLFNGCSGWYYYNRSIFIKLDCSEFIFLMVLCVTKP